MEDNYTKIPVPQQDDDSTKYPADFAPGFPATPAVPVRKHSSGLTILLGLICLLCLVGMAFQTWRLMKLEDTNAAASTTTYDSLDAAIDEITRQDIEIYDLKQTISALENENAALSAELAAIEAALEAASAKLDGVLSLLPTNDTGDRVDASGNP